MNLKAKDAHFLAAYYSNPQVWQLSFTIIHLTTIALPAWHHTCSKLGLKQWLIPHDIVTQWNSTYNMMHFVLMYRKAADQVTADKDLKLGKYELDNNNWIIVGYLVTVPKKYKKATVFFSQDGASVAAVILAMDKIDNHLNPTMKNPYHPAIQAVMKLVCKKLNQYYSMTDLPLVYQIAMGN